uniref:Agenet-like domain-containing protein n=1 Tax=Leersia perrieri TaxID=77586 RepID=A0A0D9XME6_9ORYZ
MEGGRGAGDLLSSQNFQLAGEDNSKFPAGLRQFPLPKLDIDDQLHNHLRFDNLIDSEEFFSGQGHGNSWIEVLSAGSSVVDFSSTAAESCSINRKNNVWSEATSTESVEMLLKSVGENEMTENMDDNAHRQLSGMDSQTDPSNMQPKSSNSPSGNIIVPSENDKSQSTRSEIAEDPSRIQPQLKHITAFSMDEKTEQAVGSTLSDKKSNYTLESVSERCIVRGRSSSQKNTPESCPDVGSYFEAVHVDDSLDNLNIHTDGVDSRKLDNEPFSDLAPLQNIYATSSYHFEQDNQESGVPVTTQGTEICHVKENKDGLHGLQNFSCTSQHLVASDLTSEVSNAALLSESSDGLLEAITNPVKMLHKSDDTSKRASATLQPSFLQVEHAAEGIQDSIDRSNEPAIEKFGSGEEPNSAKSDRVEPDLKNSNPHLVVSLETKSGEFIQSPKGKQLDHVTEGSEDTKYDRVDDANLSTSDDIKHREQNEDSVDNPSGGVMEEKTVRGEISAVSMNTVHIAKSGHGEKGTVSTSATNDKFDSLDNVVPGISSACLPVERDPSISSVNHEMALKEGDVSALEHDPATQHFAPPNSGHQEKKSASINISKSIIDSVAVSETLSTTKDRSDCSEGVVSNDSSALLPDEKISAMNHEVPLKDDGKSTIKVGEHNTTPPVSEPFRKGSTGSVNPNIDAICGSGTDAVAEIPQCEEHATSSGSLITNETKDTLGDHPDANPQKVQTTKTLMQSERHEDIVAPSSALGVSPEKAEQNNGKISLNGMDDLGVHIQENKTDLEHRTGDGSCTDATCGSPTVISCNKPCPEEDGQGNNALLHHKQTELPMDPKDNTAETDNSSGSKESSRNVKPTLTSEETRTAEDKSFSFEVGTPLNISKKAHAPAWSPLPRSEVAQSPEATSVIPKPGNPSKNSSSKSKESAIVETGKEHLSGRKVVGSAEGSAINSHAGHSTKAKSTPLKEEQQHPTPQASALGHQPFTDLQHVQLRAQIFVYGALIQGMPPAEPYMVSAFGESVSGGGKPAWEAILRAASERYNSQRSSLSGLETPTSSLIGSRVAEKGSKGTAVKTEPASKKGGKIVSSSHTTVPHHLPTFNMSPLGNSTLSLQRGSHLDFSQAVSPVFPYSSQMRQPTSSTATWFPQSPGPRTAPWLVQPQNLIFDSSMQSAVPTTVNETTKGASSKNISISQAVSPVVPSTVSPLKVIPEEKQNASASTSKRRATAQKSRKRKKAPASPEQQPTIASFSPATQQAPGFTLSTHSPSNILTSGLVSNTGLITSVPNYQITGMKDAEQRILSEQISGAIEQSMGQAKGAGVHAMDAIRHAEGIWSHLSTNSKGKLPAEVEQKLTSAAAAASAAVSVAKAAAEAAKMASEAALQAKMMAEEVFSSSVNSLQKHDTGDKVNNNLASLSSSTPTSSWKINDSIHPPGSIISVAREVARKRVEEASAAAKRAENLDAILKAAELAAEAVFKAGTIIGMGEPLPFTLSELLEAGPDGYWKSDQVRNKKTINTNNNLVTEQLEVPKDSLKSGRKRGGKAKHDHAIQHSEPSSSGKEMQLDGVQSGNMTEDVPTVAPLNGNRNDTAPNIIWNGIEKGSAVEVLADKGGSGVAWFSAKVLDISNHSAYISYDSRTEETGLREECVPLKQEGEKAPQIRLAHPATISRLKGTRKRRRDTSGNYSWAIGDHVDAWIGDSGDSLVVDAWNLRPSLVWKDGQWIVWSRGKTIDCVKGDSPHEKRRRTKGSVHAPTGGEAANTYTDKSTNAATKQDEPKPLSLSERDMVFNIGKSVVESKTDGVAFKRPGLRKEGSRVVGVPKPGKKKKFMEVSKHYDADQADKVSEGNVSTRPVKHLVPHLPRPREGTSKVDQKGKRIGEMRSRGLKSTVSQDSATNIIPGKGSLSMSVPSSGVFESSYAFAGSATGSSNNMNLSVEKNSSAHSVGLRAEDTSVSELQMQAASTVPTTKKNLTTTDRAKRKHVPSMENSNRTTNKTSEIPGKNADSTEPRRSNRRIQPTSRLLEGLQSSLIVSKVPGEKGPRTNYRSASSRGKSSFFVLLNYV